MTVIKFRETVKLLHHTASPIQQYTSIQYTVQYYSTTVSLWYCHVGGDSLYSTVVVAVLPVKSTSHFKYILHQAHES